MDDPRLQLQPHLRSGDSLVWTGRPDPAVRFTRVDRILIPVSVFVCGFAVVWETLALRGNAPWFFLLFGVPFVLMGLWLLIGRFFYKAHRAKRTAYGLTDNTALIAAGNTVTEIPLRTGPMTSTVSRDGTHLTVILASAAPRAAWGRRGLFGITDIGNTGAEFMGGGSYTTAFYDVADVAGLRAALNRSR